ncbi:probable ATP-dependent RNA helicase ddx42 [Diaphorina citri]|uniref:Probable ATP-dependent RNA helicase ddx42 n=1 Tax=Diaphorina citri TaxID=121845 RepID=A0A1S3DVD5_DIACI|nr:probable ATP-dependent RNA helicase ddx42 [Diaphorina citri]
MFPTVATVYGLRVDQANPGFVATLALDQNSLTTPPVCPTHPVSQSNQKPIQKIISNMQASDPVTQAVIDNVAGKLPLKKKPVRCEVCDLELSGPSVYETHITGAKHKKRLAISQSQGNAPVNTSRFSSGPASSGDGKQKLFSCPVCTVTVNSIEQLEIHKSGKQHKRKVALAEAKAKNPTEPNASTTDASNPTNASTESTNPTTTSDTTTTTTPTPAPAKPEPPLPQGVTKKIEGNTTIYTCTLCDKWSVSMDQLNTHLTSKKHKGKERGLFGQRFAPYDKKKRVAKATFSSFRSGGVLGVEKKPAVVYPSYNANMPNYSDFGFSSKTAQKGTSVNTGGYSNNYNSSKNNYNAYNAIGYNYKQKQYNNNQSNNYNNYANDTSNYNNVSDYNTNTYESSYNNGHSYNRYEDSSFSIFNDQTCGTTDQYGSMTYPQGGKRWKEGGFALFANKNTGAYNYDKITPSKAKNYFNTTQHQAAYQTQEVYYQHLLE